MSDPSSPKVELTGEVVLENLRFWCHICGDTGSKPCVHLNPPVLNQDKEAKKEIR